MAVLSTNGVVVYLVFFYWIVPRGIAPVRFVNSAPMNIVPNYQYGDEQMLPRYSGDTISQSKKKKSKQNSVSPSLISHTQYLPLLTLLEIISVLGIGQVMVTTVINT